MPKTDKIKVNVKERVEDNAIDLSLSELTEVPVKDIASFKRVTIVDLSSNKIISLGKTFSILTSLTRLDLSKNQLKYLPDDFGKLRNLRHLDLYNNRLEHLPLSFGNLTTLRYLDLKANPLTPALAKIVGPCFTTKDCNEAAKNTVKFLDRMQHEVEKAKQQILEDNKAQIVELEEAKQAERQKQPKKAKKKSKSKKLSKTDNSSTESNDNAKSSNSFKAARSQHHVSNGSKSNTALRTLFVFFFLLAVNIFMIYMITVKNPEIAEKIAELIPEQYRNLIVSKMELVRLQVSDWIGQFRTPPEQN